MYYFRLWDTYNLSDVDGFNADARLLFSAMKVRRLYLTDLQDGKYKVLRIAQEDFHSVVYKYIQNPPHCWLMHPDSAELPGDLSRYTLNGHFDFDEADLAIENICNDFPLVVMPWGPEYESNCLMIVTKDGALNASIGREMLTRRGTAVSHPFFRILIAAQSLKECCNAVMIALFPSDSNGSQGQINRSFEQQLADSFDESKRQIIRSYQQQVGGGLWDVLGGPFKAVTTRGFDLEQFATDQLGLSAHAVDMSLQVEVEIGEGDSPIAYPLAIYRVRNPTELYALLWLGQCQDVNPVYVFPTDVSNETILALLQNYYGRPFWYDLDCLVSVDWVLTVGKVDTGFYFAARDRATLADVLNRSGGKMVCCY